MKKNKAENIKFIMPNIIRNLKSNLKIINKIRVIKKNIS
jgi:hypothetical protein